MIVGHVPNDRVLCIANAAPHQQCISQLHGTCFTGAEEGTRVVRTVTVHMLIDPVFGPCQLFY